MSNLKSILTSFHVQNELNPKIWELPNERFMSDPKGQVETMVPKVRERLLQIAYEFIEFLNIDIVVSDVIMTGSLANYNWSKFSDVDLHILVDFNQLSKAELPLYEELFQLKKPYITTNTISPSTDMKLSYMFKMKLRPILVVECILFYLIHGKINLKKKMLKLTLN